MCVYVCARVFMGIHVCMCVVDCTHVCVCTGGAAGWRAHWQGGAPYLWVPRPRWGRSVCQPLASPGRAPLPPLPLSGCIRDSPARGWRTSQILAGLTVLAPSAACRVMNTCPVTHQPGRPPCVPGAARAGRAAGAGPAGADQGPAARTPCVTSVGGGAFGQGPPSTASGDGPAPCEPGVSGPPHLVRAERPRPKPLAADPTKQPPANIPSGPGAGETPRTLFLGWELGPWESPRLRREPGPCGAGVGGTGRRPRGSVAPTAPSSGVESGVAVVSAVAAVGDESWAFPSLGRSLARAWCPGLPVCQAAASSPPLGRAGPPTQSTRRGDALGAGGGLWAPVGGAPARATWGSDTLRPGCARAENPAGP